MYAVQPQQQVYYQQLPQQIPQPFTNWLDGSLYEGNYNVVWDCYKNTNNAPSAPAFQSTFFSDQADLLKEFDEVLTKTTDSLTPPESPKNQQQSIISILQEIEPAVSELDQMIAKEAERQTNGNVPDANLYVEPWSSPSSSNQSDSGYDDPEWSPSSDWSQGRNSNEYSSLTGVKKNSRKTTTTEERKMRKKEQNKNAATRYRQKKKQEMEGIMGEEKGLQDENDRLKIDKNEKTQEIRYLKSLLRDLFKVKGLLPK